MYLVRPRRDNGEWLETRAQRHEGRAKTYQERQHGDLWNGGMGESLNAGPRAGNLRWRYCKIKQGFSECCQRAPCGDGSVTGREHSR